MFFATLSVAELAGVSFVPTRSTLVAITSIAVPIAAVPAIEPTAESFIARLVVRSRARPRRKHDFVAMSKETAAASRSTGRRIRRSTATTGAAREFRERELDSLGFLFFLRLLHGRRGAERRKRRRVLLLRRLSQGWERGVRRRGVVFRIIGLRQSRENTHITRRQSFIVAFARESAEDALALRPRRLRPPEPIESRTVRTALSARAIERTPSIDRSIDPAHFPSSHSRVIPRVPSLIPSPARRSSRSSIARGAADASSREMRARRRTRARPTRAIDIARDGRGDIFRVARTRSLHAAAFPHAMVESCACDARLALGL